jgi:hypothetical protein
MKRPRSSAGDCTDFRCGARSAIHQGENSVPARKAGNGFQSLVGPKKPVFESVVPILNGLWAFMRSGDFRSCAVVFLRSETKLSTLMHNVKSTECFPAAEHSKK